MSNTSCWIIDRYEARKCENPSAEFALPVALHGHSCHSEENLGRLNDVMQQPILKQIHEYFNRSFRRKTADDLDYSDFHYCPPITPEEAYELELRAATELGFDQMLFALTDHDKIDGCLELLRNRPYLYDRTTISEEFSLTYGHQVFHLGIHNIPEQNAGEIHETLQDLALEHRHDDIFDLLESLDCLVIFNHPLWEFHKEDDFESTLTSFLQRYGWAIHAFEYNGLRSRRENNTVVELAERYKKSVVGGGDRHAPIASLVLTLSRDARTFTDFIEEVKTGRCCTLVKNDYFQYMGWKLFVRVLHYLQSYRKIAFYRNVPLTAYPIPERIMPDVFADLSRFSINMLNRLNLVR